MLNQIFDMPLSQYIQSSGKIQGEMFDHRMLASTPGSLPT